MGTVKLRTIDEIKQSLREGKTIYWSTEGVRVILDKSSSMSQTGLVLIFDYNQKVYDLTAAMADLAYYIEVE